MIKYFLTLISILLPMTAVAQTATPEIPDPSLPDIAMVRAAPNSPTGAVIIFNPNICSSIGQACYFFKFHEHGHVVNGHQFPSNIPPMEKERDADLYAARMAYPQAIVAGWQLFMSGGSSSNWHTYGTPAQRALRLCRFAKQAGRWIGPDNAC